MQDKERENLFRSIITKICKEGKYVDLKYDAKYADKYSKMFKVLEDRKDDLPSVEFLEKTLSFQPLHDSYTIRDVQELLNDHYTRWKIGQLAIEAAQNFKAGNGAVEVIKILEKELKNTKSVIAETSTTEIDTDPNSIVEDYKKWREHKGAVRLGFAKMDKEAPFRRGELNCIIGHTNSGKSHIVAKMTGENIKDKTPTTIVSLEMSRLQVVRRILPILTDGKVKNSDIRDGIIPPEELQQWVETVFNSPFNVITRKTNAKINVDTIETHLEEMKNKGKLPEVIYLDYFNLLDQDVSWAAAEGPAKRLKALAGIYDVCIVMIAQTDTMAAAKGEMPGLMQIAENKGVARDCDNVLGFVTDKSRQDQKLVMNFQMLKRRDDSGFIHWCCIVEPNIGEWEDDFYGVTL